jgi:glycosyltransferase involved in cell wall biosynthesis
MLSKKIRIGFLCDINPLDRRGWSGTYYKLYETIKKTGADVVWIPLNRPLFANVILLFQKLFFRYFVKKRFLVMSSDISSYFYSKCALKADEKCNLFFSISSISLRYKLDKPVVYLTDATFKAMENYYYFNLSNYTIKWGNLIQQKALNNADSVIVSSDWAKNSAIDDYGIFPSKISVLEFGANVDEKDIDITTEKSKDELNLLFLGVDWKRKGGDKAVSVCKKLNEMGIKTTIFIVGPKEIPQEVKNLPFVSYFGFLNKNKSEEYDKLMDIIKKCHCLLLPTIAECSAIAFAESSAFGLPVFSHNTGGVSNYVLDGKNGYLLPLSSSASDFANKMAECYNSGELNSMRVSCVEVYRNLLNWNVWQDKFEKIVENLAKNM